MGSEFFWFYDVLLVAIVIAMVFKGSKKGAVAVLISAVSAIISFLLAFIFCGPVSDGIYGSFIEKPLKGYIDEQLENAVDIEIIKGLSDIDMNKAVIGGKYLSETEVSFDEKNSVIIDLSTVDLSATGANEADLSVFGIGEGFDYGAVKIGNITVTKEEYEKYGLGNIVLAHALAANLKSGSLFEAFEAVGVKISEVLPIGFGNFGEKVSEGRGDSVYSLVLSVIYSGTSGFGSGILSDVIDPIVLVPLKIIVFLVIFALLMLILNIIAQAAKLINRIPVISSVNELLGAVLGFAEAVIILMIISFVIRFIISASDNLVFLNEQTIEKTIIFRHIYNLDPLKLLSGSLM